MAPASGHLHIRRVGLVALWTVYSWTLLAQQPKVLAPHRAIPPRVEKPVKLQIPATPRSMAGGVWMTDANYKSSIYLRNVVETDPITVTPILYLSNGRKYTLPNVTVEPAGTAIIDINDGLRQQGISSWATLQGHIELQYKWPWDPFCATIRVVDVAHSLIFTYGVHPQATGANNSDMPTSSTTVEGMWWKQEPNVTGFVALANLSSQPVPASVEVTDSQSKPIARHTVTVSPHGMKLIQLHELQSVADAEGGIRITSPAAAGSLIVNGGLEDQSVGYSAIVPFAATHQQSKKPVPASIGELGLMAGAADPMMRFPAGTTFTPYTFLRNASSTGVSLTPTVWWIEGATAHSAHLPPVNLLPHEAQSIDLAGAVAHLVSSHFNGTFNLTLDGEAEPGSVLAAAGSVDQTNSYVFEVTPRDIQESASKSMQYWSTGNGDDTMVTMWNPADEPQDLVFKMFFAGGHYALPIHLEPRATRTFNVSEVAQTMVPDSEGNIIPASIHEGSAKITGSRADHERILVAVDAGVYNVRKATCNTICFTCDGWVTASITPNPFSVLVENTTQLTFSTVWDDNSVHDITGFATWNGGGNITVNYGLVTGLIAGSTGVSAGNGTEPIYTAQVCTGGGLPDPCPVAFGVGGSASGSVGDATPVISGINPNVWNAGSVTQVTISGHYFGTNAPTLNFSPTTGISYSLSSYNDTQIVANITVAAVTPDESVSVSVTNNGYGGSGFLGGPGQSAQSSSVSAHVTALAAPAPQIWFNGNNVTGTTTNVVVGQQIALSTVANNPVAITGNNWTIPGTIVGGYNATTASGVVVAPTLSGTSTTVYWVYAGQNLNVQYSYCMVNNQCSPTATATFTVQGVSSPSMSITNYGSLTVDNLTGCSAQPGGPYLVYGNVSGPAPGCSGTTTGTPGIMFTKVGTKPGSGNFFFVQLIYSDTTTDTRTGATYTCTTSPGVDGAYPYAGKFSATSANDAPEAPLPSTFTTVSRTFNATMYLMWKSSTAGAVPVPLGYQIWQFSGSTTQSNGSWGSPTGSGGPVGSFVPATGQQQWSGYPTWSGPAITTCH